MAGWSLRARSFGLLDEAGVGSVRLAAEGTGEMDTKAGRTEFGHWVRLMRSRRGLTQDEAAWAIGVASSTVGHWETGYHRSPTYAQLVAAVRLFRELPPALDRALRGEGDGTASGSDRTPDRSGSVPRLGSPPTFVPLGMCG